MKKGVFVCFTLFEGKTKKKSLPKGTSQRHNLRNAFFPTAKRKTLFNIRLIITNMKTEIIRQGMLCLHLLV